MLTYADETQEPTTMPAAYVSIRQHTSAYVSIRQRTSAYVSIRQHTPGANYWSMGMRKDKFAPSLTACQSTKVLTLLWTLLALREKVSSQFLNEKV
jgi:hypothetical protein